MKQQGGTRISSEMAYDIKDAGGPSDQLALSVGKKLIEMGLSVWQKGCVIELSVTVRDDPRKWEDPLPGVVDSATL